MYTFLKISLFGLDVALCLDIYLKEQKETPEQKYLKNDFLTLSLKLALSISDLI